MALWGWFDSYFAKAKAVTLSKRGSARAKKSDFAGAIEDYSAALILTGLPGDLRVHTRFNRALAYVGAGCLQKGLDELNAMLQLAETPLHIRKRIKEKLARMIFRSRQSEE